MSVVKSVFSKATVGGVSALILVLTLAYLAITGAIQGETFLAAVVGGPLVYLYGKNSAN